MSRPFIHITPEQQKAARKLAQDKYRASPKYREWLTSYQSRPDVKRKNLESVKRWQRKPGVKEYLAPFKMAFNLKDKYGITVEDYNRMLAEQNGVCAICGGVNENGKKLAVDHNHSTGKVRGLLCGICNRTVGNLRDSAELASKTADYIRKHEGI